MPAYISIPSAAFMLLFALNGRLRAKRMLVWKLGLVASEFGVFFVPFPVAFAVWCLSTGPWGVPAALLSLSAAGLLLCPEFLSYRMTGGLPGRVRESLAQNGLTGSREGTKRFTIPAKSRRGFPASRESFSYPASAGIERSVVFYRAASSAPAPCVVMVHSGGWESGSPEEFPAFQRMLAKAGYAVASFGYGLTPEFAWPVPRDDMRAAIVWLKANAAKLNIDEDNLVLFGRSAGGQIALCVAYDEPDPSVRGVVSFYAPTDMVFAWTGSYDGDILDSPKLLKNYLGGRPHEAPESHESASPIVYARRGPVVPTLLLHGLRDELVWCLQLRRLAHVLRRRHAPHVALILPWARHGFDYRANGPGGRVARVAMLAFLDEVTGSSG